MKSFLSILGLYNFDDTIFDNLVVPDGVMKHTLIHKILLDCAELEVIYPNPDIMKEAVGFWSNTRGPSWKLMDIALSEKYDALHNYIMEEDLSERGTNENSVEGKSKDEIFKQAFNGPSMMNTQNSENGNTVDSEGETSRELTRTIKGNTLGGSFQSNIKKELELRKTSIYDIIVNEFKKEFCVLVY